FVYLSIVRRSRSPPSLHDALPISPQPRQAGRPSTRRRALLRRPDRPDEDRAATPRQAPTPHGPARRGDQLDAARPRLRRGAALLHGGGRRCDLVTAVPALASAP